MIGCFSRLRRQPPKTITTPPISLPTTPSDTPTSSSTNSSSSIFKNFNSLYDPATTVSSSSRSAAADDDLSSAIASRRFFLSSPGRSNSIVDSKAMADAPVAVLGAGVAVPTYSPDPYKDFLASMEEMVAALGIGKSMHKEDRASCLHELLLCYLALNKKDTHKYIVSAFAELLIRLAGDGKQRPEAACEA